MTTMKNAILNFVAYTGGEAIYDFSIGHSHVLMWTLEDFLIESSNVISPLKETVFISQNTQKPLCDTLVEDFVDSQQNGFCYSFEKT